MSQKEYIFGTEDQEIRRLGFQHFVWTPPMISLWNRAGIGEGQTVLDLGCGPGFISFDLAKLVGERGKVIAVDTQERYLSFLKAQKERLGLQNIEVVLGDAADLKLLSQSVDAVYARWVLCFIPNLEEVIREISRVLRPGGAIVVQDYYRWDAMTLSPHSDSFRKVVQTIVDRWHALGGNSNVGASLPGLLEKHEIQVFHKQPLVYCADPGSLHWRWLESFFFTQMPRLVEQGILDLSTQESFKKDWLERSRTRGAFCLTPPMIEIAGRR